MGVALPLPLRQVFEYAVADTLCDIPRPGSRVRVPLGRRSAIGIVLPDAPAGRDVTGELRTIEAVLDSTPAVPPSLLRLCQWAAAYYQQPIGPMLFTALPAPLRRGESPELPTQPWLVRSAVGSAALGTLPGNAVRLRAVLEGLAGPRPATAMRDTPAAAAALRDARARGWVVECATPLVATNLSPGEAPLVLSAAQQAALDALPHPPCAFSVSLLDGVTGSGKTELYLRLAARALEAGRQVLVLAPEIGLTPQLAERFARRFGERVGSYHSGMGEAERCRTWLRARDGSIDIVVGTRSAVFVPLARPGLLIIDEEHDLSYRQQDGVRYSARDLAAVRAQAEDIPLVLGSATPALETLANAGSGRYAHVHLRERAGGARLPRLGLIDVRARALDDGLSQPLLEALRRHLDEGGQALLFLNRRGFAPVLLCHACGWSAECPHCDAHLTVHRRAGALRCHHCGHQEALPRTCPACVADALLPLGEGTERTEAAVRRMFPQARVERIDSDRARSAKSLARIFEEIRSGAVNILIGTQLLAKGHDFPQLSFAGLVNTDAALFSNDFRATERMAQQIIQVAGRVGRAGRPGEVLLQTHCPDHPLLRGLLGGDYGAVARTLIAERRGAGLPPFAHLALLRADATQAPAATAFLQAARGCVPEGVEVMGPVLAPMERRAGRFRAQLLLRALHRPALQAALASWVRALEALRTPAQLRWNLEVDPGDLY